jgi:hypothetical protein
VPTWAAGVAAAFRAVADGLGLKKKVKATPFGERNGDLPYNASGVVQVGPGRFLFVDNHDPSALFELALDAEGAEVERISRRPLAGLARDALRDPEGLARVSHNGEVFLIVGSSLCVFGDGGSGPRPVSDGLVRARYGPHGDLCAEAMEGFRDWLLREVPWIGAAAHRLPDAGGLNIEGLSWDPQSRALLFGLRGPADPDGLTVIRVPVDAAAVPWTVSSFGPPSIVRVRLPGPSQNQGIRDISYDEQTGQFLVMVGRSTSAGDEPFRLCEWDGKGQNAVPLDVKFHREMKPEGVVAFSTGDRSKVLVVDDRGGYAVFDYPRRRQ